MSSNEKRRFSNEDIEKAVKQSKASLAIEGMYVTEEDDRIAKACLTGEMTIDEVVADLKAKYKGAV